jgi:N-acyl-D-aspartate/D-glutamate deacylase
VDEALTVSREAGLPLEISHLKVIGLNSFSRGKISGILKKLEAARKNSQEVDFDCYPYTNGSTYLSSLIPKWAHEGGTPELLSKLKSSRWRNKIRSSIESDDYGGENWLRACGFEAIRIGSMTHKNYQPFVGQDLGWISAETAKDPFELLFDILLAEQAGTIMVFSMMRTEDMQTALVHPLAMIGTDAIPCPPGLGRPHPRGYGTFPKILGRLSRDQGLFSLEAAVYKMTGRPAAKFGLKDKGKIAEGMSADLVIFDRDGIMDHADYSNPRRPPTGISHILVEGVMAMNNGRLTGRKAGRFL